jgi:uncharacterized protein (TIGR02246 family)
MLSACNQPPDTREADVKAIKDVEAAWVKDVATKDVEKFASYYADDASFLVPNMPIATGKDAIRNVIKSLVSDPNFALTFQSSRVEVSKGGDLGYSQGTYSLTMTAPITKQPAVDKGKYVTVFKKQRDASWKAVADMINSDGPPK